MIAITTRYGWATNEYRTVVRVYRALAIVRCAHCGRPLEAGSLLTRHRSRQDSRALYACRRCIPFVVVKLERNAA